MDLPFVLLNVFTVEGDPFSGNPLCVFPDAGTLDATTMQAWARQLNLSESTFVTAHDGAAASVRIFAPGHEMPFAGHPTLGTAEVVAGLGGGGARDLVHLDVPAGRIEVRRTGGGWRLTAPPATTRPVETHVDDLAAALGIDAARVVRSDAAWVDAGVEQLLVRVDSVAAVRACRPEPRLMVEHLANPPRPPHVYAWAWTGPKSVEARLFFTQDAALVEDPATGSAAANLGGWLVAQGVRDVVVDVTQGAAVRRPSRLVVEVDAEGTVHVGGRVDRVGGGSFVGRG